MSSICKAFPLYCSYEGKYDFFRDFKRNNDRAKFESGSICKGNWHTPNTCFGLAFGEKQAKLRQSENFV